MQKNKGMDEIMSYSSDRKPNATMEMQRGKLLMYDKLKDLLLKRKVTDNAFINIITHRSKKLMTK